MEPSGSGEGAECSGGRAQGGVGGGVCVWGGGGLGCCKLKTPRMSRRKLETLHLGRAPFLRAVAFLLL